MCFFDAFLGSESIGPPVDVEDNHGETHHVLVGDLSMPWLVVIRPGDVLLVGEFGFIPFFEVFLPDSGLGLNWTVFVVTAPVVVVVVVCSQEFLS